MKIWLVRLEALPQRYTTQMHEQIIKELDANRIEYEVIGGDEPGEIKIGAFLDAFKTSAYKAGQLKEIAELFERKEIAAGDAFMFYDVWFPGVESIRYMSHFAKIPVKMFGIAHAGSWTPSDFVAKIPWAPKAEALWFSVFDEIFVGTEFHRQEILKNAQVGGEEHKFLVTRLPFWKIQIASYPMFRKGVVFAGRPHVEKGFDKFIDLAWEDKSGRPYVFTGAGLGLKSSDISEEAKCRLKTLLHSGRMEQKFFKYKGDFYAFLADCEYVFSWAEQENWGYSMLEAVSCGCIPLCNSGKSYTEMFSGTAVHLFDSFTELQDTLLSGVTLPDAQIDRCFDGEVFMGVKRIFRRVLRPEKG